MSYVYSGTSSFALLLPLPSSSQSILLVILRRTHRPIPTRPLRAHSIKRVAFIPSIFTRDVSSSAAGFFAIRVTGSAISLSYPYPYTTSVVREIEGKNASIRILYGYYPRCLYIQLPTLRYCTLYGDRIKYKRGLKIPNKQFLVEINLCLNHLLTFIN